MGTKRVGMARVKSLINENVNQLKLNKQEIVTCTAAKTLKASQSGCIVYWTHSSAHNITLPTAKAGMHFRIVIVAGANAEHKIVTQSADKVFGRVQLQGVADNKIAFQVLARASAGDEVRLKYHSSVTAQGGGPGDVIDLVCGEDGYWICNAQLCAASGATPSSVAVLV